LFVAAVSGAIIAACSSPSTTDFDVTWLGMHAKITINSAGHPELQVAGSLPQGKCLKVEYRGADGASLGTDTMHIPGSSQVPSGSVSQSFSIVDCPPPSGSPSSGGAGAHTGRPVVADAWVDISGFPVLPNLVDGGIYKNAMYHFRVKSMPGVDPFSQIEPILLGGPGTVVPPDVEVVSFTQFIPDALGGRLLVGDTDAFDEFRLDWNGQHGYADLATGTNAVQHTVGSQWHVVESVIPLQDFHVLVGETNHGLTHRKTIADAGPSDIDVSLTVLQF
jgi:hypothetical protein